MCGCSARTSQPRVCGVEEKGQAGPRQDAESAPRMRGGDFLTREYSKALHRLCCAAGSRERVTGDGVCRSFRWGVHVPGVVWRPGRGAVLDWSGGLRSCIWGEACRPSAWLMLERRHAPRFGLNWLVVGAFPTGVGWRVRTAGVGREGRVIPTRVRWRSSGHSAR